MQTLTHRWPAVLVVLATCLSWGSAQAEPPASSTLKWRSDLKEAHQESVRTNKPLMIVFGAAWCGYCKKMDRETLTDTDMVAYIERQFIPVHLDLDDDKKVADILEIEAVPCTVVLSPKADLLGRKFGYLGKDKLRLELESSLRIAEEIEQTGFTATE